MVPPKCNSGLRYCSAQSPKLFSTRFPSKSTMQENGNFLNKCTPKNYETNVKVDGVSMAISHNKFILFKGLNWAHP